MLGSAQSWWTSRLQAKARVKVTWGASGPKFDTSSGYMRPLGNAMLSKGAHVLVVDVLAGEGLDLRNDSTFEQLLRLCFPCCGDSLKCIAWQG